MKTLIELFDKEPVENVYAAAAFSPERVVYAGDAALMTPGRQESIRRFFRRRGLPTKLVFCPIRTDDAGQIAGVLDEITKQYPDCVCDVTGGTDLLLVSVGMLAAKKKLPVLFFNVHTGSYISVFQCEEYRERYVSPVLSVEDLMTLAGGSFIRHGHYAKELDLPENRAVAEAVWEAIRTDIPRWIRQAAFFQQAGKAENGEEKAETEIEAPERFRVNQKTEAACEKELMRLLEQAGAIDGLSFRDGLVRYRYLSPLFRRLLSDAGVWLELYTYYTALRTGFFDDVKTSVIIDWDGEESAGTVNEVDDILIKGITPLFISCKIGVPSVLAINEIETLTRRFGGSMARPALVTACRPEEIPESTRQRAADMDVKLIEAGRLSREAFARALTELAGLPRDYFRRR